MKGTLVKKLHWADNPITISLTNGSKVPVMHIGDIYIPSLPTILTGHIVPGITMTPSLGQGSCAKWDVKLFDNAIFDNAKCEVFYKNNVILRGNKDPIYGHSLSSTKRL
jgi:hypothetical protein